MIKLDTFYNYQKFLFNSLLRSGNVHCPVFRNKRNLSFGAIVTSVLYALHWLHCLVVYLHLFNSYASQVTYLPPEALLCTFRLSRKHCTRNEVCRDGKQALSSHCMCLVLCYAIHITFYQISQNRPALYKGELRIYTEREITNSLIHIRRNLSIFVWSVSFGRRI